MRRTWRSGSSVGSSPDTSRSQSHCRIGTITDQKSDRKAASRHRLRKTGKPRKTSVDRRVTRHVGYDISQRCRKRIEEVFGWIKASAGLARIKLRGRARVDATFTLALAAYNLVRLPKLLAAPA